MKKIKRIIAVVVTMNLLILYGFQEPVIARAEDDFQETQIQYDGVGETEDAVVEDVVVDEKETDVEAEEEFDVADSKTVFADDSGFTYSELNGSYITITGYTGSDVNVTIPNTIDGFIVQSLSKEVFKNNKTLKSVIFNKDCEKVGDSVFEGCTSLESITFNDKITAIGARDFYGCTSLKKVNLPDTITQIYGYAFGECSALSDIVIPDSVIGIGYRAFYDCDSLETINYPLGWKETYAYSYNNGQIFAECDKLKSVVIPEGVTRIAPNAFSSCANLETITLPSTLISIGDHAFDNCDGISKIEFPEGLKKIEAYAFSSCDLIEEIQLPDGLTSVGLRAFEKCKNLASVNYPKGWVESPTYSYNNGYAFAECPKITEITIPEGVTKLAPYALSGCASLKKVTLPDTLTSIGDHAFKGCTGLASVVVPENVEKIEEWVFESCTELTSIELPDGLISLGAHAFDGCTGFVKVELPDSIESMGHAAFNGCTGLKEINYPLSWKECPTYSYNRGNVFNGCINLKKLVIPEGVTSIPNDAFSNCTYLKEVTFASTIEKLGQSCFNGCTGLTSVCLNDAVTTIGNYTFGGCTGLEHIWIGEAATSISDSAFNNCSTDKLVIHGVESSTAQAWAEKKGYTFSTEKINAEKVTVSGKVVDTSSKGIPEVAVTVYDVEKKCQVCQVITDVQGSWSCDEIVPGKTYRLQFYHQFYDLTPSDITLEASGAQTIDTVKGKKTVELMEETSGTDFTYKKLNGSYISITGYTGSASAVRIPNVIDGYTVQTITENAFKGNTTLETIIFADEIESVGNSAFEGCTSLETVALNGKLKKIDSNTFRKCTSLKKVNLPDTITQIYGYAFGECSALSDIVIPDSVIGIGYRAFYDCDSLETINYPLGWKETYAYSYNNGQIFAECDKLKSVVIPEGVTRIAPNAFSSCANLETITLPSTLISIGDHAFDNCDGISKIEFPEGLKKIEAYAFSSCDLIEEIQLPDGLTSVGLRAFEKCKNLASVNYPKGWVESPTYSYNNGYAFAECPKITEITIPEGVTKLAPYALSGCASLKKVTLPDTLTSIGDHAFKGCTGLASVVVPENVEKIEEWVFESCTELTSIELPDGLISLGAHAFDGCTGFVKVELPDSIESMGHAAFNGCTGLKEINYPLSWKECPTYSYNRGNVFNGCINLKKLVIPEGVTSIPNDAFSNCKYLRNVIFPSTLETIGQSAFYGCIGLPGIILNEGLKDIGKNAFYGCDGLITVTIPDSVSTLGDSAFNSCKNLQQLHIYGNSLSIIPSLCFANCSKLQFIYLSGSIREIAQNAFTINPKMAFYCPFVSYATLFAIRNSIPFVASDNSFEDDENSIIDRKKTYYCADLDGLNTNGFTSFTLSYSLNSKASSYNNKKIEIFIPKDAVLEESTIKRDGVMLQDYVYEDQSLTLPVNQLQGTITFSLRPSNSENLMSYAQIKYDKKSSEVLGILNESVTALTLYCDESVSNKEVSVSGFGPKQAKIFLYVNEEKVKETVTSKVGKYNAVLPLKNCADGSSYVLKAECEVDGETKTALASVTYIEDKPELTDLKMYYNNHSNAGIDLLNTKTTPFISFNPSVPFTFTADFTNKDAIDDVYIVSTRNNVKKTLEAKYDKKTDKWVASGYFDESNHSYVPGSISVDINTKHESAKVDENFDVAALDVLPVMKNATVVQTQSFANGGGTYRVDMTDALVDMGKDVGETYLDYTISMIDDAADSNLSEIVDFYKAYETLSGYIVPGEDGRNWFATADYSDPTTYTLLLKDASSISNKVIKLGISLEGSGEWTRLDEIAPNLGIITKLLGANHKIAVFNKDRQSLKNEIMMDSSIKNKGEALQMADQLYQDQVNYTLLAMALPLLCTVGFGLTGPAAIGLTALVGIMDASASYFWKMRVAQIKGKPIYIKWGIDPSGYVYEGVTSNRLSDVTVSVYYKEKPTDKNAILWDAEEYDQANPLVTGNDGAYAWDVPEGYWQVKCEKEGYLTAYSDWMEVPPPQTNVNICMYPDEELKISSIDIHEEYAEIVFNQYCKASEVKNVRITDANGRNVEYEIAPSTVETDNNGEWEVNPDYFSEFIEI